MKEWWQHFLETLDPVAFTIGFFAVYWYAIFFLVGFFSVLSIALYLVRRGEAPSTEEDTFDLLFLIFFGAVLGARIGYVMFYNLDIFLTDPLRIFLPYDFGEGRWTGIAGMSYHGGLVGGTIALFWHTHRKSLSFWRVADFIALLIPIATFFGRLGNFFNLELPGRITAVPWGMIFPHASPLGALRHPSSLYEALLEGVVLFLLLLFFRKKLSFPGALACLYLGLYAVLRFIVEFFRSPDPEIGFFFGIFTLGQLFSFGMLFTATVIFFWLKRRNCGKI